MNDSWQQSPPAGTWPAPSGDTWPDPGDNTWPGPGGDTWPGPGDDTWPGPGDDTWPGPGDDRKGLPHRSDGDRKIAGVAGGLGRALGIDPVILRVALVVLTVFGGFGVLLYVLGWLLLPDEHDRVSAAGAILGRGRSSVPPALAVTLAVVAAASVIPLVFWGRFGWPAVVGAAALVMIMRGSRRGGCGSSARRSRNWTDGGHRSGAADTQSPRWSTDPSAWGPRDTGRGRDWEARVERQAERWNARAQHWADKASRWGDHAEQWASTQPWAGPRARSPFGRPAFWEQPTAGSARAPRPAKVDLSKPGHPAAGTAPGPWDVSADGPDATVSAGPTPAVVPRDRAAAPRRTSAPGAGAGEKGPADFLLDPHTPPAWDPLGVAPFAWDLPEPSPLPTVAPVRRSSAIARITISLALLTGAITSAGIFAGWWTPSWAQVSAGMLTVVGLGLLIASLRGRGWSLLGPGVLLALVTLALTVTGIRGTDGFGERTVAMTSPANGPQSYSMNAGNLVVDLSQLNLTQSQDQTVDVHVGAGHAEVIVPAGAMVDATCDANAGDVNCLGNRNSGSQAHASSPVTSGTGTIHLTVTVGGGYAEVHHAR